MLKTSFGQAQLQLRRSSKMSTELLKKLRLLTKASIPDCTAALEYAVKNASIPNALDISILQSAINYLRIRNIVSKHIDVPNYMNGLVYSYTRPNNEMGVLLELRAEKPFPSFDYQDESYVSLEMFCIQLCQHIVGTAISPVRVSVNTFFDLDIYEREIYFIKEKTYFEKKLVENVDVVSKPYIQAQKIIEARIAKWEEEATLLSQKFLFKPSITVADFVKQLSDKLGFVVEISKFTKYSVST